MAGFDNTAYQSTGWDKTAESILTWNTWYFDQNVFPQRGPGEINAGPNINFAITYSTTDSGGTLVPWGVRSGYDTVDGVQAYFTKTAYENSGLTDDMLNAYENGSNPLVDSSSSLISEEVMVTTATNNAKARATAALILEMEGQIDSSGSFGDGALLRATYGLASYEDTDGGVIKLQQLEDTIENLQGSTYGNCTNPESELVFLMPRNQLTNVARAGAASEGVSFNETNFIMTVDSQSGAPIDAGRVTRTKTFEGIPIIVVSGMTTTNILLIRKGTCTVDYWWPIATKEFATQGYQRDIGVRFGINFVCRKPSWNGKISGLTA